MPASALLNVMTQAARKAGRSLARDFGEVEQLQVSVKGPANFVTAADHRAEDIIFKELSKARPGYGFQMEERGVVEGNDKTHRWIVDPLDGTTNFLHGHPMFGASVAVGRGGQLEAGAVVAGVTGERWWGRRGGGEAATRYRIAARETEPEAEIGRAHV